FMSPEQFTDARTVGPASDVFSLAALLVYSATGHGPFDAGSPYVTAYRVVHDEPQLDGVSGPLRPIVERCLAKKAEERPGLDELAREFAAALPEATADDPFTVTLRRGTSSAGSGGGPRTPAPPVRRRRLRPLPAATATVGALALGLTAYLLIGPGHAESAGDASYAWRTTLNETSPRGAKQPLDGVGSDTGQADCAAYAGDVYCAGDRTLPVRLDGRTGRTVWRADIAPSGSGENTYSATVLGIRDHTVLVRQTVGDSARKERTSVMALDTGTGERLWARGVDTDGAEAGVSGDLVLLPDGDGRSVTARSPRTGAKRWTAALPKGQNCTFVAEAETGPYLGCRTDSMEDTENALVLALDPADGSLRRLTVQYTSDLVGVWNGTLVLLGWGIGATSDGDTQYTEVMRVATDGSTTQQTVLAQAHHGTVTLAGGTLWFAASNGEVTAVSPADGTTLWKTRTALKQPGAVRYDAGTRTVYVASTDGRVAALDARKGTPLWDTQARADSEPAYGSAGPPVLLNNKAVVVATGDGGVLSVDPAHPDRKPASG
ncbi:outer membrane protein assembly factor BamB family protein, partial [Streptomyces sp. NPDC001537]